MKIKIIFTEPPYEATRTQPLHDDEKRVFIRDPYNITMIEGARSIVGPDGATITYEQYCIELQNIIDASIRTEDLTAVGSCDEITIVSCKEPPNFEALNTTLAKTSIPFASTSKLTIKDCSFGGSLYVSAVSKLVRSAQARDPNLFFNITLDEQGKSKLSDHDKAKLASLNQVAFFPETTGPAALRRFTDDTLLEIRQQGKTTSHSRRSHSADRTSRIDEHQKIIAAPRLKDRFLNPTYLYRAALFQEHPSRSLLLNFFSQGHQQRSDYTCGPSALKMVADYYTSMGKLTFCGEPVSSHQASLTKADGTVVTASAWKLLNSSTELELSDRVKTTEEVGSELADMREGLMALGLPVLDDSDGFSSDEHDEGALRAHKEQLWNKLEEIIKLGIPVVINLRDRDEVGHYEVAIGIDEQQNIIFAEPGAALTGEVEFESVPKERFIDRWKNMSGKLHGRFLIVPPNEASAQRIESILRDTPHYFNGSAVSKTSQEGPAATM